jgi:lipopolysaccharide export system protein LptC
MSKRQTIPYILLLVAFLAWLYLKPEQTLTSLPEHHPSYIAYGLSNDNFDENGELAHRIFSTKATSYSDKDITIFENPKVLIYIKNKENASITTWQVTSERGTLSDDNVVILYDDVWVKNLTLDQLVQTMNTEKLTVLLDKKEISSELLVHWQGPQMEQQGIGMWASLVSEELIVKKQIKAIYLNETK